MFTGIITLLGSGLGGLLRLAPEVIKWLDQKDERRIELRRMDKQQALEAARANQQQAAALTAGDIEQGALEAKAYIESIRVQSKPTGNPTIDGINALVRPAITAWWMLLFTLVKTVIIAAAVIEVYIAWTAAAFALADLAPLLHAFIAARWTPEDAAILSAIIMFWFTDRAIRKYRGH